MIKPKPKSKAAGPVSAGRVKSFVERIERLEEERKAIGSDVRDVYAEAKGVGYDVKTLRWMVQERKVDAVDRDERDLLRDTYAHALGLAVDLVRVEGLSLRQAEDATGVSKSSIQRALSVPEVSREMTADDLGDPLLLEQMEIDDALAEEKLAALIAEMNARPMPSSAPVAASGKEDLGVAAGAGPFGSQERANGSELAQASANGSAGEIHDGVVSPIPTGSRCAGGNDTADGGSIGRGETEAEDGAQEVVGVDPRPKGTPTRAENAHVEIDLTIPAHLDQRKRQAHA